MTIQYELDAFYAITLYVFYAGRHHVDISVINIFFVFGNLSGHVDQKYHVV
jgi:hypothetical protein